MDNFLKAIKKWNHLPLYIYPLFYLFTGVYFKMLIGDLSLTSVDPDYVNFLSGVSISEGYFKVGHIDHPGTPLQYLIAIVLRIVYLFRKNAGVPYLEDVLGNPDLYISVVNVTLTILMTLALFAAGKYVWRKTGSVLYGMAVQTTPFIPFVWYQLIGRVMPELLLPLPVMWLSAFLLGHLSEKKEKFDRKDILILSSILALSLSIKLTMISLWIIPFFIVRPWRSKLIVGGLSIVLFLVFALPATLQIERFWGWISNLFVHSGNYGSGSTNIVDFGAFASNFTKIIGLYKYFTFLVLFQIVLIPVSFSLYRQKLFANKKIIFASSVFITILFQALITAKHFAPHYFIPAILLGPLLLLLSIEIIKDYFPLRFLSLVFNVILLIFIFWNFNQQLININYASQGVGNHVSAREETRHYIKTFEKESIKIIVSQGYGCPMPEYAILFSTAWLANPLKPKYTEVLAKLYPKTYQYTTFDDRFRFWGEELNTEEIIEQNIPVYLYLEHDTDELYNKAISKIFGDSTNLAVDKELIFHNNNNGEGLLRLNINHQSSNETQH